MLVNSLKTTNLVTKITPEGLPIFYDDQGNYQFNIEAPFARDAAGATTYALKYHLLNRQKETIADPNLTQLIRKKVSQIIFGAGIDIPDQSYTLALEIDDAWLHDPHRVLPITIDPTVVHNTQATFATGQLNRVKDVGAGNTAPSLTTYYQELPVDQATVALWHMNETVGTSIVDASGNGNKGTLATGNSAPTLNVTSTLNTGISFGGNQYLVLANGSQANVVGDEITIEMWIKPVGGGNTLTPIHKYNQYSISIDPLGSVAWADSSNWSYANFGYHNIGLASNTWQHLAITKKGGVVSIYLNGTLGFSQSFGGAIIASPANPLYLGCYGTSCGAAYGYVGSIDEVRISNIARTPEEIRLDAQRRPYSVYTSPVIDITHPISVWNSLSWTESGIGTGDGETLSSGTSLVAQWNFNESSGTSATVTAGSCGSACNGTLVNFANTSGQDVGTTGDGWSYNNRRWGNGALTFDGVDDYVDVGSSSSFSFERTNSFSVSTWFKGVGGTNSNGSLVAKVEASPGYKGWELYDSGGRIEFNLINNWNTNNTLSVYTNNQFNDGQWHFVVATYDGSNTPAGINIYVDGVSQNLTTYVNALTATILNSISVKIGQQSSNGYFAGSIDSTTIYSRVLTASEILSNYNATNLEMQTRVGSSTDPNDGTWEAWKPSSAETAIDNLDTGTSWFWDIGNSGTANGVGSSFLPSFKSTDSTLKLEGSASQKIAIGVANTDTSTIGLWHLEETDTAVGSTFYDSSSNAKNGIATTVPTVTDGIAGKGRKFNGSTQYISIGSSLAAIKTVDYWIYPTALAGGQIQFQASIGITASSTGRLSAPGFTSPTIYINGQIGSTISLNSWNYITVTTATGFTGNSNTFGRYGASYFTGTMDEVRVSNVVFTSTQIAEAYRLGANHRLSRNITPTNLSSSGKVGFSVAADRPGTYLEMAIGESGFSNYEPDPNTVGLWHLDENPTAPTGIGVSILDSSGNGNNGISNNLSLTTGIVGAGDYYSNVGATSYILITSSTALKAGGNKTVSGWFKTGSASGMIFDSYDATHGYEMYIGADSSFACWSDGGGWQGSSFSITDNNWHFGSCVWSTATGQGYVYLDGQLISSGTRSITTNTSTQSGIGVEFTSTYPTSADYFFNGYLDEIRVDSVARTPSEIRAAYEYGRRSHQITIDFAAKLVSSNLVGNSGDFSFNLDTTGYGTGTSLANLYLGDKIILKEKVGATEFLAQGTVNAVNNSSGAVTVSAWDVGSSFPSGGYTVNASVFKWQNEYFDLSGILGTQRDAVDRLTLRFTNGNEGRSVWLDDLKSVSSYLTNNIGSTITSSTGKRYFQYRSILTSNDYNVSPSLTSATLDYGNTQPFIPTLVSPGTGATGVSQTPTLKTVTTDLDADILQYQLQICKDSAMSLSCSNFTAANTGWSGADVGTSSFNSGTTATYIIPAGSSLAVNTTYYWKTQAIDPAGSNILSGTQTTPFSFTTNQPPLLATLISPGTGSTNVSQTPTFKTVTTDPESNILQYQLQICKDSAMSLSCNTFTAANTGWSGADVGTSSFNSGTTATYIVPVGSSLAINTTYYWKTQAIDPSGSNILSGTQTTPYSFSTNLAPNIPTLISPADVGSTDSRTPIFKTVTTDPESNVLQYQLQICKDSAMSLSCVTFNATRAGWSGADVGTSSFNSGTTATYIIPVGSSLAAGAVYFWKTQAIDPTGSNVLSGAQTTPFSFTISIPQPPPAATNEDYYEVDRNVNGVGWSGLQTTLAPGTTAFNDTSITAGNTYQYRVAPYFTSNGSTPNWCYTTSLSIQTGNFLFNGLNFNGLNIN